MPLSKTPDEIEAQRLRNILEGKGCRHGRLDLCVPCDPETFYLAIERMKDEGGPTDA